MLTITKCKKKLNKNGVEYNNEEAEMIRSLLYQLAEINIDKITNNDKPKLNDEEKRNNLYSCKYR